MILFGTSIAMGAELDTKAVATIGIAGVLILGMALGAYIKQMNLWAALATVAAPLALVASVSMGAVPAAQMPTLALAHVTAAVERGNDGHFRASADINGTGTIEMLVDTGASVVLLSYEHAEDLNLDTNALAFDVPVITANGRSAVAMVKLSSLSVGGVTLEGVEAAVAQPGQLHSSLLGMSYLGGLKEVVLRGNEMILTN